MKRVFTSRASILAVLLLAVAVPLGSLGATSAFGKNTPKTTPAPHSTPAPQATATPTLAPQATPKPRSTPAPKATVGPQATTAPLASTAPDPTPSPSPVVGPAALTDVTALALGEVHACALLTDHTVRCWGNNVYGQLGNGTPSDTWTPVTVLAADGHPLSDVTAITAGRNHTCALKGDRTVWCWGHDLYGELGTPNVPYFQSLVPVQVTGIGNAVAIAAGAIHTCAVLADQTVKCWGNDGYGQLGNGTVSYAVPGPLPVNAIGPDGNPLGGAIGIAAGAAHTCARMIDGTVWCWGYNEAGQLGNGTTTDSSIAVVWPGLTTTTAISAGHSSTCALLADQTVRCWGGYQSLATFGSLAPANSLTMAPVPGITTATALTSGAFSACAVLADQTVRCWGDNESGQLGNGTLTDSATPVTVTTADGGSLTGVTALAVGPAAYSTCAVLADQTVRCWGSNVFGQLGNNTATDSLIPVTVVAGP